MADGDPAAFDEWAIVELMGHRRLAGKVTEAAVFGATMLRLDIWLPGAERPAMTQLYGAGAVYCLTPCGEQTARKAAARLALPAPVQRWELERADYAATDGEDPF